MSILGAIIVPHPPLIIPTVGRGRECEVQATIDAYRTAAKQVADWGPEVLIITSPHQIMYADYFHISPGKGASGDMSAFGAAQTRLSVEYDSPLRDEIIRRAEVAGLRAGTLGKRCISHAVKKKRLMNCSFFNRDVTRLSQRIHLLHTKHAETIRVKIRDADVVIEQKL